MVSTNGQSLLCSVGGCSAATLRGAHGKRGARQHPTVGVDRQPQSPLCAAKRQSISAKVGVHVSLANAGHLARAHPGLQRGGSRPKAVAFTVESTSNPVLGAIFATHITDCDPHIARIIDVHLIGRDGNASTFSRYEAA
ncbi:hypothetical protein RNZ50_08005 [Paracoccaceae bacterium Fryx2]|nr:hypothetical protein [Paracoccaceae bacterium Fryx2]